jgi:ABC-type transporter Mla MlaB component
MGASAPQSAVFTIHGPISREDLPGLCDRICALLRERSTPVVVCHVDRVEPDAVTVDALCRLQLAARRRHCRIQLVGASSELRELVELMGLTEVFA